MAVHTTLTFPVFTSILIVIPSNFVKNAAILCTTAHNSIPPCWHRSPVPSTARTTVTFLPVRRLVASIMSLKSSSFLPPLLPSPMIDSSRQGHPNDLEVAYPLGSGLSDAKAFFHPFHKIAGVLMPDVVPNKHIIFSFSAPSLLVLGFSP